MKLSARDAPGYFAKPDTKSAGLLIYGEDAMRVALRRQEVIRALIGPDGEDEMRLTRIPAADLRKDGALLLDAVKAQGFFPGPRVAFVEDATDAVVPAVVSAFSDWAPGDAQIVVTAGALKASSKLRKSFEAHPTARSAGIYNDPPGRAEIEAALAAAGFAKVPADAMEAMTALARVLDPGDFRQTIEKVALYKLGDETPLTAEEVALSAPVSVEAALDDVIEIAADGGVDRVAPVLRRLEAQGVTPVSLCIAATRHFRSLHVIASDPGGPGAGIGRLRPSPFGPRRDRLLRQAREWGVFKTEKALAVLLDTDLALRSSTSAPQMALIERALLRIAHLARR